MEPEDLDEVVEAHARTAGLVQESGMDGVEIHSAYGGYLLSSFLSPYMNDRADEYGGDLEGRSRLPLRVVHAVRERVGPDYIVGMQINGHDFSPGGIELPDAQEIARRLVATGAWWRPARWTISWSRARLTSWPIRTCPTGSIREPSGSRSPLESKKRSARFPCSLWGASTTRRRTIMHAIHEGERVARAL